MDTNASAAKGLRRVRTPSEFGPRSDAAKRVIASIVASIVAAVLVAGLILLTVIPGGDGRPGNGPDRPAIPLSAPGRP